MGESTLTWSNSGYSYGSGQSLNDATNFSDLVNLGTLTGVTQSDQGGSVNFSSAALDSFLNSDSNNITTFLVRNINGTGSFNGFYAREHSSSNGATLTVIPEPSSVLLAALGLITVIGLSRKRRG